MTQEDKELLLKDLSARLPYGVIVAHKSRESEERISLGYGNIEYVAELGIGWWKDCKPYLRPMSSMTEEEEFELNETKCYTQLTLRSYDWLNAHHFDYRGLIERGLAIAVTKENNPYKL